MIPRQGVHEEDIAVFNVRRFTMPIPTGFVLRRQEPAGKWTAATYALTEAAPPTPQGIGPVGPMAPGRYPR
jgi:hypothetical protein